METIGYIYYDDGSREEATHLIHGDLGGGAQAARRSAEQSTAQMFAFRQRNYPGFGRKPTRFDVQQF